MEVTRPRFTIAINAKDVTADLTKYAIQVSYTDRTEAKSDEVEISLNNSDGRFTSGWYFSKGDKLDLAIGYDNNMVPCGTFTIDQIEASWPAAVVTVRALAAGTNSPLRTKRSAAHQDKTIKELAQAIAAAQGFTINDGTTSSSRIKVDFIAERKQFTECAAAIDTAIATLNPDTTVAAALALYAPTLAAADSLTTKGRSEDATLIRQTIATWRAAWIYKQLPGLQKTIQIAAEASAKLKQITASLVDIDRTVTRSKLDTRIAWMTQDNDTDLEFLHRVAKAYGVLFSVRGTVMTFTSIYDVEATPPADTIRGSDVLRASFRDSAVKNYAGVRVVWHDPKKAESVVSELQASTPSDQPRSGDILEIRTRAETQAQADEIAKAALHRHTSKELTADVTFQGRPLICAGCNIDLAGFGVYDGKWAITESQHTISVGGGYTTAIQAKRGR